MLVTLTDFGKEVVKEYYEKSKCHCPDLDRTFTATEHFADFDLTWYTLDELKNAFGKPLKITGDLVIPVS